MKNDKRHNNKNTHNKRRGDDERGINNHDNGNDEENNNKNDNDDDDANAFLNDEIVDNELRNERAYDTLSESVIAAAALFRVNATTQLLAPQLPPSSLRLRASARFGDQFKSLGSSLTAPTTDATTTTTTSSSSSTASSSSSSSSSSSLTVSGGGMQHAFQSLHVVPRRRVAIAPARQMFRVHIDD